MAAEHDDIHTAALIALSRMFLLRVPSEGIPLQWDGEHSKVEVTGTRALITLTRRKNREYPSVLERSCCCQSSSPDVCGVHWLHKRKELGGKGRLFHCSVKAFVSQVQRYAQIAGIVNAEHISTHAFRRGMAQDIVNNGGTLATLLKAGDWHSKAFFKYLRDSQVQDKAIAELVVLASDSEDDL